MNKTGRFETTTKTTILTKCGTILKIIIYREESLPETEYVIRPACIYCEEPIGCICFNPDNSDDPLEDALSHIEGTWVCEKIKCLIRYQKENDPEYYETLKANYNGNEKDIADAVSNLMPDLEEGDFCLC